MTNTYTREEVKCFVEHTLLELETQIKESSALSDSYLDDPSDEGFRAYWINRGVAAGLAEAVSLLEKSEKQLEDKEEDELKACPCCGSTRVHVSAPDNGCYCWECGLTMPDRPNWRERWNRRVKE